MNDNICIKKDLNFMYFNKLSNDVISLFTFKPYDFNINNVSKDKIISNYSKIEKDLNYSFKKIVSPVQTHTNVVKIVNEDNINDTFQDVDGLITNIRGVGLATKLADCQGILMFDRINNVIGNIHSGWKGTLNRIIVNAIQLMISNYNSKPENIEIYIVPSILSCCFEVDEDVKDLFVNNFQDININKCIRNGMIKNNKQKYYIDTVLINKMIIMNMGIKEENIILSNICSKCKSNYIHSYRSEGIKSGRNIALICLK